MSPAALTSPAMKHLPALLALTLFTLTPLPAQDTQPEPADLHALRDGLLDAINQADLERQLTFLHPNVVITYQNAEVARGREGVRAFLLKMTAGPEKLVESVHIEAKADGPAILHGDTAIVFGSAVETYKMAHGSDLTLNGRWTAMLVKEQGQWLVAALHCSTGLADNPLIAATKKAGVTASIGSIVIGLIAGWLLGRKRVL